jgi:hypothetical protein
MPTKYTYSISSAFPNEAVNSDKLRSQIASSSIPVALQRIDTAGDDCDIWFVSALETADESTLSALVSAHDGVPLPSQMSVTADTTTATNAKIDVPMPSMTLTPGAGTYSVFASAQAMGGAKNDRVILTIYANGVKVANSERSCPIAQSDEASAFSTAKVTIADGQAIKVYWRTNNGAGVVVKHRSLFLTRIEG